MLSNRSNAVWYHCSAYLRTEIIWRESQISLSPIDDPALTIFSSYDNRFQELEHTHDRFHQFHYTIRNYEINIPSLIVDYASPSWSSGLG